MTIRLHFRMRETVRNPIAGFWLTNQANILVYRSGSVGFESGVYEAGSTGRFDIKIGLHLVAGTYTIGSWIGWGEQQIESVRAPAHGLLRIERLPTGHREPGSRVLGRAGRGRARCRLLQIAQQPHPILELFELLFARRLSRWPPASAATSGTHSVEPASLNAFLQSPDDVRRPVVG